MGWETLEVTLTVYGLRYQPMFCDGVSNLVCDTAYCFRHAWQALFVFVTILLSCTYALTFFPALLSTIGPTGDRGNFYVAFRKWRKCHGGPQKSGHETLSAVRALNLDHPASTINSIQIVRTSCVWSSSISGRGIHSRYHKWFTIVIGYRNFTELDLSLVTQTVLENSIEYFTINNSMKINDFSCDKNKFLKYYSSSQDNRDVAHRQCRLQLQWTQCIVPLHRGWVKCFACVHAKPWVVLH